VFSFSFAAIFVVVTPALYIAYIDFKQLVQPIYPRFLNCIITLDALA